VIGAVGWLVVVFDIAQFAPQGYRTAALYRRQHGLRGLSLWTWSVATVQAVLWVVYGLATHRAPIAVPNIVIAPICLVVLLLAVLDRRGARQRARSGWARPATSGRSR
jgi:uncharacterized protein with PQ loop repeat